jgi:hypothetical protein
MSNATPTPEEINATLARFDEAPQAAMNRDPEKVVVHEPGGGTPQPFAASVEGNAFVVQRDQVRQKFVTARGGQLIRLDQILPGRAPFGSNDRADDMVDLPAAQILRTLEAMEQKNLLRASLGLSPWSSTYWPMYMGQTAARYADPKFPAAEDWKANRTYIEQNPASDAVASGDQGAVDSLSPAEKYDLLVGDDDYTLSQSEWKTGQKYYDDSGSVETWMGICHGWSPAAYLMPRPVKVVSLLAADGHTKLTFFPADIKALGCLLWAQVPAKVRLIGARCTDKDPATDPESGRLVSPSCFDVNPGAWHLSVVNQLGLARRGMIIDASYDWQVWNQPLYSYSYTYFNPQTRQAVSSLKDARVDKSSFTNDKFAKWRVENGKYMVGVAMRIVYVAETTPGHETSDNASRDRLVQVDYMYDLEHDDNGVIIGGEWYLNKHPNFLWTASGQPASSQDAAAAGEWSDGPIPDAWGDAAAAASADGQPLAKIVNRLFQMAR